MKNVKINVFSRDKMILFLGENRITQKNINTQFGKFFISIHALEEDEIFVDGINFLNLKLGENSSSLQHKNVSSKFLETLVNKLRYFLTSIIQSGDGDVELNINCRHGLNRSSAVAVFAARYFNLDTSDLLSLLQKDVIPDEILLNVLDHTNKRLELERVKKFVFLKKGLKEFLNWDTNLELKITINHNLSPSFHIKHDGIILSIDKLLILNKTYIYRWRTAVDVKFDGMYFDKDEILIDSNYKSEDYLDFYDCARHMFNLIAYKKIESFNIK